MSGILSQRQHPVPHKAGNLYTPQGQDGMAEGRQHGRRFSTFTAAARHPLAVMGTAGALAAGVVWATRRRS